MNIKQKNRIYIKSLLLILVVLVSVSFVFIKGITHYGMNFDYEEAIFNECFVSTNGYLIDNDEYVPENSDPQMILEFGRDEGVYGLRIYFEGEIDLSKAQIYFGRDDAVFYESDSKLFGKGESKSLEVISTDDFEFVRIDIDQEFAIDSVEIAKEPNYTKLISDKWLVVALLISVILAIIGSFSKKIDCYIEKLLNKVKHLSRFVLANYKQVLKIFGILVALFFFSYVMEKCYGKIKNQDYFNRYRFLVFYGVAIILAVTWWFRKNIIKYAHIYFFIIVILVGGIHVFAAPRGLGLSWDDIIHYGKTSYLSWGCNDRISFYDNNNIAKFSGSAMAKGDYAINERIAWEELFDGPDKYLLVNTDTYEFAQEYVAYIPGALGLIVGRGIGLDYIDTFMLGKFMNVLWYAIFFSLAIKLMKNRGKLVVMTLGLIPTSLFMASSYSYDWWVISLIVLGYAILWNSIQCKGKISTKKLLLVLTVLILAILPKAIYFPLIFPIMLLGKDRFENAKMSRMLVVVAMFILLATFMLPMVLGTRATGDVRGGQGVNANEQIKFILTEPLEYVKILFGFLEGYMSFDNSGYYLTFMAYYGMAPYFTVCIMVLIATAIVDNNNIVDDTAYNPIMRIGSALGVLGCIVLAATALYVSFTPVRHITINGCQPRYILPVLFVGIFHLFRMKINVPDKIKNNMAMFIGVIMSFIFLYGIYDLCIAYY